jgi:hypothetical protein
MPQSKDSPDATVWTAPRAELPEDAGRSPPEVALPLEPATEVEIGADEPTADGSELAAAEDGASDGAAAELPGTGRMVKLPDGASDAGAAIELPGTGRMVKLPEGAALGAALSDSGASLGAATETSAVEETGTYVTSQPESTGAGAGASPLGAAGAGAKLGNCGTADAPSAKANAAAER